MLSPYLLQEADQFSYLFITDKGITYHVYFLDYSYMFADYPGISNNVYSFNIEVMDGDADTAVADERIGLTMVEVFRLFFSRMENVSVRFFNTMLPCLIANETGLFYEAIEERAGRSL